MQTTICQEKRLGDNPRITILNTEIDVLNVNETIALVEKYVQTKTPLHLMGVNADKINEVNQNAKIAFQKCIDDRRSNIPPDRESDKDGVVFVHVITLGSDGRARGRIAHFDGAAGFLVHPVQIGLGVRNFRLNLKNVCTDSIGKIFSNLCGNAAGGEVSNKSFAHDKCTSFD